MGSVRAGVHQRACALWPECVIDSRGCARVRVRMYVRVSVCGGRVMVVIVVVMSARIEAASSGSVAVVLFAGIFR